MILPEEADNLKISDEIALKIEEKIRIKLRESILNYSSDIPLSKSWVKKKGNDKYFLNSQLSYYTFGIRFLGSPVKWNDYEVYAAQEFKFASYQYIKRLNKYRTYLENGQKSFDSNGKATKYLREYIDNLILIELGLFLGDFIE